MPYSGYIIFSSTITRREKMAAKVDKEKCVGCESCVGACPVSAIAVADGVAQIDEANCIECGACVGECPTEAISL